MKLNRVTSNDPIERVALSMHKSVADTLRNYQAYYKTTYGDEIALSHLVEEVVKSFVASDKDFGRYMADARAADDTAKPSAGNGSSTKAAVAEKLPEPPASTDMYATKPPVPSYGSSPVVAG